MSKYDVSWTGQFKKDYKLARKRNLNIELLDEIIRKLARGEELPKENRDHALSGNWLGYRECHIQCCPSSQGKSYPQADRLHRDHILNGI